MGVDPPENLTIIDVSSNVEHHAMKSRV